MLLKKILIIFKKIINKNGKFNITKKYEYKK